MAENKKFDKIDFTLTLPEREYNDCEFNGCNFSELTLLSTDFENCKFNSCNFIMTRFKAILHDVVFNDCKMTGADFSGIKRFSSGWKFKESHLDYCNFTGIKLRNILFKECKIQEAYFDDADLTGSVFEYCNLERSSFAGSNLEKVDFSQSYNFIINPELCKLKKTIFSENGLKGLVAHLNIEIIP